MRRHSGVKVRQCHSSQTQLINVARIMHQDAALDDPVEMFVVDLEVVDRFAGRQVLDGDDPDRAVEGVQPLTGV